MRIRFYIKRLLGRPLYSSEMRIIKAIDDAEVVSFDIFDTLVKRDVRLPEQIHDIVERKFNKQHTDQLDDYRRERIRAEVLARKNAANEEITLKEIFQYLEKYPTEIKTELYKLEIETEMEMCCPDHFFSQLYRYACQKGKRIVITSDMYLPESIIRKILEKCDINNYEKLYLSSSYKKNKRTGNLYDCIKADYPGMQRKILHIGDNMIGDYLVPFKRGIRRCLIDGDKKNLRYWKRPNTEEGFPDRHWLYAFLNNRILMMDDKSDASVIGYEVIGPIVLGFCQWLYKRVREDRIEKLFFLSREGKFLQEAYHVMHPEESLPQCYLHVSRRALLVPLVLETRTYDDLINLTKIFLHAPQLETIGEICSLDKEEYEKGLRKLGLDIKIPVYEVEEGKKTAVIKLVHELGHARFLQQKNLLNQYLEQNGFGGKNGIVDICSSGTMQRFLVRAFREKDVELYGYYMGVRNVESEEFYLDMKRYGYLFSPGKNKDINYAIRFTTELFETLFLSTEGSVLAYNGENGRVVPVLNEVEYREKEKNFIETVQRSALRFLKEIRNSGYWDDQKQLVPEDVFQGYVSLGARPSMRTVELFQNFVHTNGTVRHTIVPKYSLFYYLIHPRKWKAEFETSKNKIFFLRKTVKLNLPYVKILEWLEEKGMISRYQRHFLIDSPSEKSSRKR